MKSHEFHARFGNTPIADRTKPLKVPLWLDDKFEDGKITLSDIFDRVSELEDKMRPDVIELEKLLDLAGEYYLAEEE